MGLEKFADFENQTSYRVSRCAGVTAVIATSLERCVRLLRKPCYVLYAQVVSAVGASFHQFASRIVRVHVIDAIWKKDRVKACSLGKGEVGYCEHSEETDASGYRGHNSFESNWRRQALTAEQAHLRGGTPGRCAVRRQVMIVSRSLGRFGELSLGLPPQVRLWHAGLIPEPFTTAKDYHG